LTNPATITHLDPPSSPAQSHLLSRIIAPALKLWLRSQVEQVQDLQVKVSGGDRQILAGYIPQVMISAQNAVYQGLHLSQIRLSGENIRINLGQVLRGKPLRLLDPVPVAAELLLQSADLNASLQAPLLRNGLHEFLTSLLSVAGLSELANSSAAPVMSLRQVMIGPGQLTLSTQLQSSHGHPVPLVIQTGLQLASPQELRLKQPQWLARPGSRGLPLPDLDGFKLDLGPEVKLEELRLALDQLTCRGEITVLPAES